MNANLLKVSLRYDRIYVGIPDEEITRIYQATGSLLDFVAQLRLLGYQLEESALHALAPSTSEELTEVLLIIRQVKGVDRGWTPLVKGWNVPTGEGLIDHLVTAFANMISPPDRSGLSGVTLPCGHFIPIGSFPIQRYNGCPFCGSLFDASDEQFVGQGGYLKRLDLFTRKDLVRLRDNLLSSRTPLDATQADTLRLLLNELGLGKGIEPSFDICGLSIPVSPRF